MSNQRRTKIKDYIDNRGEATIAELLNLCGGCSNMTLWRDLKQLEEEGSIRRTRGGAISLRLIHPDTEGLYVRRSRENINAKRAIARAAVKHITSGHAIFFDAGSTVMELARLLTDEHFTVITSGANIAIELSQLRSCNAICVGGQLSANTLSFSGPHADAFINSINIDTAVMATSGFSLKHGFTSGSFTEHELKRSVITKAEKVIMLMDAGKMQRNLPFTFATLADIDILITDKPLPPDVAEKCRQCNVKVIVADAE